MTDDERADLAQWSKDARQRSRKAILHLLRQKRRAKTLLVETENRLGRAGEDYQRARLSNTQLPPMSSTLRVAKRETPLEPS